MESIEQTDKNMFFHCDAYNDNKISCFTKRKSIYELLDSEDYIIYSRGSTLKLKSKSFTISIPNLESETIVSVINYFKTKIRPYFDKNKMIKIITGVDISIPKPIKILYFSIYNVITELIKNFNVVNEIFTIVEFPSVDFSISIVCEYSIITEISINYYDKTYKLPSFLHFMI